MDYSEIEAIKATYPKIVTKDQVYRICHISKKTALYLLESGLIPCEDSGKKTRRFRVKLEDVITYLQNREINPLAYKPPVNYYQGTTYPHGMHKRIFISPSQEENARLFFEKKLRQYKEVMTTAEVSKFLGYSQKTIIDWYEKKEIKCFLIKNRLVFPKEYLIDFIIGIRCNSMNRKSQIHIDLLEEFLSSE